MRKPKDKKLCKAVEDFTAIMLDRLAEKEAQGYSGYDEEEQVSNFMLADLMHYDAEIVYSSIVDGLKPDNKYSVDIANRAMMLWYRSTKEEPK